MAGQYPMWMYHKEAPFKKLFHNSAERGEALMYGWVEAPWLVDDPTASYMDGSMEGVGEGKEEQRKRGRPRKMDVPFPG